MSDWASVCRGDLEFLPEFLAANDPGIRDLLAWRGPGALTAALPAARRAAAGVDSARAARVVLNAYLQTLRRWHLQVTPADAGEAHPAAALRQLPECRPLSAQTLLLRLPDFAAASAPAIASLLAGAGATLAAHLCWIIDVRGNGGGCDQAFAPLLPWLLDGEFVAPGVEALVTAENLAGWEALGSFLPGEQQAAWQGWLAQLRRAEPGSLVGLDAALWPRAASVAPAQRPRRVAVLIDAACGSSCEEFLLAVRQSYRVKLLGRRTAGALDYSNLLPRLLPSGQLQLWYATTRSRRLPDLPIDGHGVVPDLLLPLPPEGQDDAAEVEAARRWLEGGRLLG